MSERKGQHGAPPGSRPAQGAEHGLRQAAGGGGFAGRHMREKVKPKHFAKTLRRLWSYISGERKALTAVFVFIACSSSLALLGPYLIGEAVDAMGVRHDGPGLSLLHMLILIMAVALTAEAGFSLLQGWLMAGVSQRIVMSLRRTLFAKLQKLPLGYFDSRPHGEIMSRLSNDIDNVSNTISQTTAQLMAGLIALVGSLVMMLVLSPLLTLAALVTVPLVFVVARAVTRKTSVLFKEQQAQLGRLNGHAEEAITGVEIVKAFNYEQESLRRFDDVNGKLYEASFKAQVWSGLLMPLLNVINNIGVAAVAIVGGMLAVNGRITEGVIAAFLVYARQFVRPLNDLANTFNVLQAGVAGAERAFEVLDEAEEREDGPEAELLSSPRGDVEFRGVGFGYTPESPILRGVGFAAQSGTSVALVGPTGAGKTTIVNLLTRFYDVTEGEILIDGRDIRGYTRDSLRRAFGIVLQDTYLFSGTIKDNIKYGRPDATDDEVAEAAALANAAAFIRRLPKQYETVLSENGGNLSQGQRQLLAIARVMLAKPSILILDEATSSIDTRTEQHIQQALLQLMKGRTSFIIAHRLNTIRHADTIMVIEGGEIAEQGTHDELYAQRGVYHRMFRQAGL